MLKKSMVVAALVAALAACNSTREPTPVETETFQNESVTPPEVPNAEREK